MISWWNAYRTLEAEKNNNSIHKHHGQQYIPIGVLQWDMEKYSRHDNSIQQSEFQWNFHNFKRLFLRIWFHIFNSLFFPSSVDFIVHSIWISILFTCKLITLIRVIGLQFFIDYCCRINVKWRKKIVQFAEANERRRLKSQTKIAGKKPAQFQMGGLDKLWLVVC